MPIIYDAVEMGLEPCRCGRPLNKVHCPMCGAFTIEARKPVENPLTDRLEVRYYCRRCGRRFFDTDWQQNCHAPEQAPRRIAKRQQSVASAKQDFLSNVGVEKLDEIGENIYSGDPTKRIGGMADLFRGVKFQKDKQ